MEERFDFVIIGAGPAGEAAAYNAPARGASVAVPIGKLFGGSCPFWACMPAARVMGSLFAQAVATIDGPSS